VSGSGGDRPAWSEAFAAGSLPRVRAIPPLDDRTITREWAWGGATGRGVKVAIIDSGVDASHPAVGGVQGYVAITADKKDRLALDERPHVDDYGHGTACAGIIRAQAVPCP